MSIKGSITALVTPMKENGELDYSALEKLINFQIDSGISALVAVGTTGESATIDFKDHIKLIEFFVKTASGRIPIIAGTGANSTDEALHLTKGAKESGADAALLVSPYYNKPPQEGIYKHHIKMIYPKFYIMSLLGRQVLLNQKQFSSYLVIKIS